MKQRYTIATIIGFVLFMSLSVGPIYAWTSINTGLSAESDTQNIGDLSLYANDGDVVTTNKWNQTIVVLKWAFSLLIDWPRGKTPFLGYVQNTVDGVNGSYINHVNFGFGPSDPYAGINLFDASQGYNQAGNVVKGAIVYDKSNDSVVMNGFSGGLRISDGNITYQYLLGWEKISLTTTESTPFDGSCQYRIKTDHGQYLYPTGVRYDKLDWYEDANWGDTQATPMEFQIRSSAKNLLYTWDQTGNQSINISHGSLVSIEKLCLPSYNPNGY